MSCAELDEARLAARVAMDGEDASAIAPDEARALALLDAHIAACADCARFVEAERSLRARVAELPRAIAPRPEVWRAIAARIDEGAHAPSPLARTRRAVTWALVAAAAALLVARAVRRAAPDDASGSADAVAASAGAEAAATDGASGDPRAGAAPAGEAASAASAASAVSPAGPGGSPFAPRLVPVPPAGAAAPAILAEEAAYRAALDAMEPSFRASVASLPDETALRLKASLDDIGASIERTRAALAASPDDADLKDDLDDAYRLEIQVVNDVIDLATRS